MKINYKVQLDMAISGSIDNNKALLLLKNIGALIGLGYPSPAFEDLTNSTNDYVQSLELFEKKSLKKNSDEKMEQAKTIISMILSSRFFSLQFMQLLSLLRKMLNRFLLI